MKLERRQKNEKIDMVWGLWAPKGHHPHNHSTERIRLPIQLNRNYASILSLKMWNSFLIVKRKPLGETSIYM